NVTDQIETNLQYLLSKQNEKEIVLGLHPFLYSYYTKGIMSRQVRWFLKYKRWIKLTQDTSMGLVDYKFINSHGEEIALE
ncbi:MAG: ribonuclease E/G, partial [Cytophagales bacterium]|nr:ribonuclease E/G [Cytophagales bacterium]